LQQIDFTSQLALLTPANNRTEGEIALPPAISGTFSGQWRKEQSSHIDVHALAIADKPVINDLRFSFNTAQTQQWQISTPELRLDNTKVLLPFLPEGEVKNLFSSLNLHGYLRNFELTWDNNKPLTERMQLQANADNVSSGHWEGVPAFTGVSGYVRSGIGYGFIDLNSNNGFSMHYPEVYHKRDSFSARRRACAVAVGARSSKPFLSAAITRVCQASLAKRAAVFGCICHSLALIFTASCICPLVCATAPHNTAICLFLTFCPRIYWHG
jgi:hypothetical protein